MKEYPIHPAAALFPMLGEEELVTLQNDISAYGQLEPIITWKGQVVDGRNRLEACRRTGQKPRFKERSFADEDAVISYIISTNIKRRHLTTAQRTAIAAELANLGVGRPSVDIPPIGGIKETTKNADAAKQMQVGPRSVERARAVLKASPELHAKVKAGELSVNAAHKQVAPPKLRPTPPPAIIPDPDLSHTDDPPPFIPPAKPKHFIGPAEGEDEDEWKDAQAEPEANWYEPTDEARAALAAVNALDEESRQWVIEQL